MSCRILQVDDHALTRAGCRLMVDGMEGFDIVAELDCGSGVLAQVQADKPDLILLDVMLPDMNGMSLLAELVGIHEIPVIILTGQDNPRDYTFALRMGARGVVRKNDPSEEILAAIAGVHAGKSYISESVAEMLARVEPPKVELSPRQTAILHYLSIGETNKEISHKLDIAMPTVSFHIAEMRRKLGVSNNKKIVNAAAQAKLI